MALVRGVIAASINVSSMFSVSWRMSTNTGIPAAQHERIGRRDKGEGRHDDLVTRPNVEQDGGHLERGGARMGQQRARAAGSFFQPGVTALGKGAISGKDIVLVRGLDIDQFLAGQIGPVERNEFHGYQGSPPERVRASMFSDSRTTYWGIPLMFM